jgi:uncharacterized protein (DUF2141 family)
MKKYTPLHLVLGSLLFAAQACAADVTVTIKNVASGSGLIRAALCDEKTFLKDCSMKAEARAVADAVKLVFKDVPPGRYALNAYHDENENRKLDRSVIGIPTEGYAFSRDARGHRGPPSFSDAAIEIKEGMNGIAVTLNY